MSLLVLAFALQDAIASGTSASQESSEKAHAATLVGMFDRTCRYNLTDQMMVVNIAGEGRDGLEQLVREFGADIGKLSLAWIDDRGFGARLLAEHASGARTVNSKRSLYVQSSSGRVVEAYYNREGERDNVFVWTPSLTLEYSPGRKAMTCSVGSAPCFQWSMSNVLHPLPMAAMDSFPLRSSKRDGDRSVFLCGTETTFVAAAFEADLPQAAAFVDEGKALLLAHYTTAVADGRPYIASVLRVDVFFAPSKVQVVSRVLELDSFRPGDPRPVDVGAADNYFEKSMGSEGVEFVGRLESIGVPALLRGIVSLSDQPVSQWKKD